MVDGRSARTLANRETQARPCHEAALEPFQTSSLFGPDHVTKAYGSSPTELSVGVLVAAAPAHEHEPAGELLRARPARIGATTRERSNRDRAAASDRLVMPAGWERRRSIVATT